MQVPTLLMLLSKVVVVVMVEQLEVCCGVSAATERFAAKLLKPVVLNMSVPNI